MAFKATVPATQEAFLELRRLAASTKSSLGSSKSLLIQPTVNANVVLAIVSNLRSSIQRMQELASTPGLATYAKEQVDDPTYDIAAEFVAMRDAMVSARNSIVAMFPKDGNGFLLYQSFDVDGAIIIRTFSGTQLNAVVSLLDVVIASIG